MEGATHLLEMVGKLVDGVIDLIEVAIRIGAHEDVDEHRDADARGEVEVLPLDEPFEDLHGARVFGWCVSK